MPQLPTSLKQPWITDRPKVANRFYAVFCCVAYWFNAIQPDNTLANDFKALLAAYPNVDVTAMGFPSHWQNENLWKRLASRWTIVPLDLSFQDKQTCSDSYPAF